MLLKRDDITCNRIGYNNVIILCSLFLPVFVYDIVTTNAETHVKLLPLVLLSVIARTSAVSP